MPYHGDYMTEEANEENLKKYLKKLKIFREKLRKRREEKEEMKNLPALNFRAWEFMEDSCPHIVAMVDEYGKCEMAFEDVYYFVRVHPSEDTNIRALAAAIRRHQCKGLKLDISKDGKHTFIWTRRTDNFL